MSGIIFKNISKIKKGFKNCILNMCHMTPNKIFKKSQHFEFFQKWGVKGIKKQKFWKNTSKIEKGLKIGCKTCATCTQRRFSKKGCFLFQKRGVKGFKKRKFWKNTSKTEKSLKNWILNMCHIPTKKIFKKSQNFEFFLKRGFEGVKKYFFWKNTSKIKKGFTN